MDYIKKIEEIKTFKELLTLSDKLNEDVANYKGDILSDDYHKHMKLCRYRNLVDKRVDYLTKTGAKLDKIEA